MRWTRREFTCLAASAAPAAKRRGLRIGVMDTSLRLAGKPEAVEQAAKLGFEGIQLSIGRPDASGRLPLSNLDMQGRYQAAAKRHNIAIAGTYLDVLHVNCLKNDEQAKQWVREGIVITRNLGCKVLMIVFFGKCELKERTELDAVAAALKELAPEAGKAGVVLGFENTISADDDIFVLDKVGSNALQVYYDVGNATNIGGFDASAEIRRLGAKRICQFHFKDKGYMGEGKVDFPAVMRAIAEIGFEGFANLETSTVSGSVEADLRRNLEFIRGIAV